MRTGQDARLVRGPPSSKDLRFFLCQEAPVSVGALLFHRSLPTSWDWEEKG